MKQASSERILIHYRNIQNLSRKQLEAVQQKDAASISASIEQKQMIIEQIQKMQLETDGIVFSDDIRTKLQRLLTDIAATEAQSRDILTRRQEMLQRQMVSVQHKKLLQAYEASSVVSPRSQKRNR